MPSAEVVIAGVALVILIAQEVRTFRNRPTTDVQIVSPGSLVEPTADGKVEWHVIEVVNRGTQAILHLGEPYLSGLSSRKSGKAFPGTVMSLPIAMPAVGSVSFVAQGEIDESWARMRWSTVGHGSREYVMWWPLGDGQIRQEYERQVVKYHRRGPIARIMIWFLPHRLRYVGPGAAGVPALHIRWWQRRESSDWMRKVLPEQV